MMKQMAGPVRLRQPQRHQAAGQEPQGQEGRQGPRPAAARACPAARRDARPVPAAAQPAGAAPGSGRPGPAAAGLRPVEAEVPEGEVAGAPGACTGCAARCSARDGEPGGRAVRGRGHVRRRTGARRGDAGRRRLPRARAGRRALPRRAGPRRAGDARRGGRAGGDRPRRRHAADPRLRLAGRHPAAAAARRPARDHPGRPAPRPAQALHPRARRGAGRPGAAARRRRRAGPRAATAGSSWSATGSTARSATSPRCGPTTCWSPRSTPRTPRGARVTAHVFGEDALPGLIGAGHRLHRARHRADRRHDRRDGRAAAPRWCRR